MAVAYVRSDTLTGTRTPLCRTQLMPSRFRDNDEPFFFATWGPLLMAGFGLLAVIDILLGHTK